MIITLRQALILALFFVWGTTTAYAKPATKITLNPGIPIWINARESAPVQRAARDLARDLQNVLGAPSSFTNNYGKQKGQVFIEILGPNAGNEANQDRQKAIAGREAHGVFVKRDQNGTRIVLQGADTRGTVYAIYTFSEKFLGVKPLWFWASQPSSRQPAIVIDTATNLRFGPPAVRWRAWFPNDTDLFTPWKKQSQANYDALYETMLRLKLNCLEGYSADESSLKPPFRLARDIETARDRGLAFVGHHIHPLGANYRLWDAFWKEIEHREPPALSVKNVEELKTFWRWHIELARRNHLEEIWLVGFRGNGDRPFWTTFKDAPSGDRERAAVIERMMKTQVELVKAATGEAAPVMRTTLYNEMSDFYAAGFLRPPVEPNLIWTFVAARRDHFPAPDAQKAVLPPNQPVGYYMNFQFTSTGAHLAQAEGPWKMEQNFRFISGIALRPLEFSVVNMGNIREFVLEGSANAAFLWNERTYNSDRFLLEFCQMYFGPQNAPAVAALYRDFYQSYWQQRKPDLAGFERQYLFQDLRLTQAMRRLIGDLKKIGAPSEDLLDDRTADANGRYFNIVPTDTVKAVNDATPDKLDALIVGTERSIEKLSAIVARANALMPRLPAQYRAFFNDNLRVQARFLLAANLTTHHLALAVRAKRQGNTDKVTINAHVRAAQAASQKMREALDEGEHSMFNNWYEGDRQFSVNTRIQEISELL